MISTVGTLTDLKGDDFWTKGVSWSCKYCGCEDLKCLWYVTKGQYSFKGSFLCRNCGKRFTVRVPKTEDDKVSFAVVIDSERLRALCKYWFVDSDGKDKCCMGSKIVSCEFQCRSIYNGNYS